MAIPTMASPEMLAVQQRVSQLQKQGMPTNQIAQVLQQEVLPTGTVPIAQLWQLMNYVKANAQKTQSPPPDSVAVQLADQVKQIAAQKAQPHQLPPQVTSPLSPQSPSLPGGGAPAGAPPGVAGLPQQAVGGPKMASGGIVAFDDGGDVPDVTDEQKAQLDAYYNAMRGMGPGVGIVAGPTSQALAAAGPQAAKLQQQRLAAERARADAAMASSVQQAGKGFAGLMPQSAAPAAAPAPDQPTPPPDIPKDPWQALPPQTDDVGIRASLGGGSGRSGKEGIPQIEIPKQFSLSQNVAELRAAAKEGGAGKALEAFDAALSNWDAQSHKDKDWGQKMAMANAGFQMAAAASRRGGDAGYMGSGIAGVLGAAAEGGQSLIKDLMANKDKFQTAQSNIMKLRYEAAHAAEEDDMATVRDAVLATRSQASERNAAIRANAELVAGFMRDQAMDRRSMALYGNRRSALEGAQQTWLDSYRQYGPDDPRTQQAHAMYQQAVQESAPMQEAGLRSLQARAQIEARIASDPTAMGLKAELGKAAKSGDTKAIATAQAAYQRYIQAMMPQAGVAASLQDQADELTGHNGPY